MPHPRAAIKRYQAYVDHLCSEWGVARIRVMPGFVRHAPGEDTYAMTEPSKRYGWEMRLCADFAKHPAKWQAATLAHEVIHIVVFPLGQVALGWHAAKLIDRSGLVAFVEIEENVVCHLEKILARNLPLL